MSVELTTLLEKFVSAYHTFDVTEMRSLANSLYVCIDEINIDDAKVFLSEEKLVEIKVQIENFFPLLDEIERGVESFSGHSEREAWIFAYDEGERIAEVLQSSIGERTPFLEHFGGSTDIALFLYGALRSKVLKN